MPFPLSLPALPTMPFWFSKLVVTWKQWVTAWEVDHGGGEPLLSEVRLLP